MAAKRTRAKKAPARKSSAKQAASTPQKLNAQKKGSLVQTTILILSCVTAVILLALLTYNPNDPGLFHHDSHAVVTNKAGSLGAYLASVLFGFFGHVAYLIPVAFLVSVLLLFRSAKQQNGGINTGITVFGVFLALVSGCGLATLLWPESHLIYKAGGLLGLGIAKTFVSMLGDLGATLLLFSLFIAGITLFADIRWLALIDKIGDAIMGFIELLMGFTSSPKTATAGADSNQVPFSDYEEPAPVMQKTTQETSQTSPTKQQGAASGSSASMLGALGAGFAGLFAWRDASSKPSPRQDHESQMPFADSMSLEPQLETPPESIVPVSPRQEPVLGFPDHMALDNAEASVQHIENPDLGIAITTKNYLNDGFEVDANTPDISTGAGSDKAGSPRKKLFAGKAGKSKPKQVAPKTIPLDKAMTLPPLSLLNPPPVNQGHHSKEQLEIHARNIVAALESYGVRGVKVDCYYPGPIITRYELLLPPGTKVSKITGLAQDMARNMCVSSIRVVEVIPGKTTIGIEVPNEKRDLVAISDILGSKVYQETASPLTMVLGKTIAGNPAVADMGRMPHLLIAGTTGSGKSVGVNAMLISLLYKATPEEVKLILIDPKMLELSIYEGIPHLLTPVVTDMKDAANSLRWAVGEMERRYALMSHLKVRNIAGYNDKVKKAIASGKPMMDPTFDPTQHVDVRPNILEPLPYIVIVIDEFADMMMVVGKKVEELIARLAQKARAAGIHLILATQRPSVDVITGLIKANIPSRIAFQVSTKVDSRTILDQGGAEALLGHGDMLYLPPGTGLPQRIHGAFVDDSEVEDVVNFLKLQGEPEYIEEVLTDTGSSDAIPGLEPLADSETDALYDQAVAIVTESRRASISYVQRRLKVGYNRAASMIEDMEKAGVVSAVQSNGTREVLAPEPPKP